MPMGFGTSTVRLSTALPEAVQLALVRSMPGLERAEIKRAGYDAVVVAVGLHLGRSTRVLNSDHPGVFSAIDLLRLKLTGTWGGFPLG